MPYYTHSTRTRLPYQHMGTSSYLLSFKWGKEVTCIKICRYFSVWAPSILLSKIPLLHLWPLLDFLCKSTNYKIPKAESTNFLSEEPIVTTLGFGRLTVCLATTQLCYWSMKTIHKQMIGNIFKYNLFKKNRRGARFDPQAVLCRTFS